MRDHGEPWVCVTCGQLKPAVAYGVKCLVRGEVRREPRCRPCDTRARKALRVVV